jgi:hypothetical protein
VRCDVDPPWVGFFVNSFFFIQGFWVTSFARKLGWAIEMPGPPGLGSGQSEARDPPNNPEREPAVIEQGPLTLQHRDRRRPDDQHDPEANSVGDGDSRRNCEQLHGCHRRSGLLADNLGNVQQENIEPAQPSFEDKLQLQDLPPEVKALREQHRKQDAQLREIVKPRAEAHIAACRIVAKDLQRWHQQIADTTDLDLDGYSRGSAVWLLAGRCLGLHEVMIVQAEAGIDNEGLVVGRALHEASNILMAFLANPDEEDLVRLWLDDDGKHRYVKQGAARAAQDRFETDLNEAMEKAGLPPLGNTINLKEELYDRMSRTAHNRRSSCVSSLWKEGRQMAYGRAPSALRWASAVEWTASMTIEVVNAVGDALRSFYQGNFFVEKMAPLVQSIEAIRKTCPLDEDSIHQAAASR